MHLPDCYHTHYPNTGLCQTVNPFIVQVQTFIRVTTLIVPALSFIRLLPRSLCKYWQLPDCYRTHYPNTGLCQTVTPHIVKVLTFIGVTTLIVPALSFIRLLPRSLCKYWQLPDCYRTHYPNTGLCQTVTAHIVKVLTFIGVTTLIVPALSFIRLLPRSLCKYWHLLDCYHNHCPITGICYHTHSPSINLYMSYHTHSPSTVLYQTATSLIVQALATVHIVQILDSYQNGTTLIVQVPTFV